ncbi:MAG: hypothetical protein ACOVOQ_16095, partial [Flavobacterium sp.]
MRRLRILFYWLFYSKNNIKIGELVKFLLKPKVDKVAKKFIKNILLNNNFYEITFNKTAKKLFWPIKFSLEGINQVTAETFD